MNLIGNILWFILGGFILALAWALAGLICCLTIIGIPLGLQCFKFAELSLAPFGKNIIARRTGAMSLLGNIIWIIFLGLELALLAVGMGLVFFVTIIGIPFGIQYFKFARLALLPFGSQVY